MSDESPVKVTIAGGSIGGLCAGIALRGIGADVQIFERESGPMDILRPESSCSCI
jgi:2-polyprenyl-6-methoxyphenol hydroxylase-like FAD-dependent oxidoreductase